MRRTLHARLALYLISVALLVGAGSVGVTLALNESYVQRVRQEASVSLAEELLAEIADRGVDPTDPAAMSRALRDVVLVDRVIEPYLLDGSGRILAYPADASPPAVDRVPLEPLHAFLEPGRRLPIVGIDPRAPGRRKVFSAAPIGSDAPAGTGRSDGFLYVVVGGAVHDAVVEALRGDYVARLAAMQGSLALAVGLTAGLFGFVRLTRRLEPLRERMERYRPEAAAEATGERNDRTEDEIGRLVNAFDDLASRLDEQVDAVTRRDRLRRELVANVSHDLRTPLAALRGYLETLRLKDHALGAEERAEYVGIAERNARRLGHLIDALFDLARLDAREAALDAEPLSLAELAHDTLASLRLRAEEDGVELRFARPDRPPFVLGEIQVLERAVANLLDNAIRHTPRGGTVTVRLEAVGNEVELSVEDTGPGIDPEDLPLLLEREVSDRASARAGGAGFGLAIVERVLELHGSELEVGRSPGGGARLSFRLLAVNPEDSRWMLRRRRD